MIKITCESAKTKLSKKQKSTSKCSYILLEPTVCNLMCTVRLLNRR